MIRNCSRTTGRTLSAVGAIVALSGCKVGPDYHKPDARLEQEWMAQEAPELKRSSEQITEWWKVFNDPVLNDLVERAYHNNPSLQAAGVRVLQAQAARGIAIGLLFPQSQEARGSATWNQVSENSGAPQPRATPLQNRLGVLANPLGSLATAAAGKPRLDPSFHNWEINALAVSWELDVWGRYRRGVTQADANVLASLASYDDVLVSLIGEVATSYVLLRTLEEQLQITEQNLVLQRRGFELAQTRFKGGTATELDATQAQALALDTESQIPTIQASIEQTKISICVLIGIPPQDINPLLHETVSVPTAPGTVALGVPADLLRRRPDIRRAERALAAQSENIGIAVADLLPHFSLNGNIGLSAEHFGGLWQGSSFQSFAGPSFRWAILNYGRIVNNIRVEDAGYQAQISEYENLVLNAQGEVERAMADLIAARKQLPLITGSVNAALRGVELAETQYKGGTADYTRVLNTQMFLINEQYRDVGTRAAAAQAVVTLYRALGGGWEIRDNQPLVPDTIKDDMRQRKQWSRRALNHDRFSIIPHSQPAPDDAQAVKHAANGHDGGRSEASSPGFPSR